MKNIDFEFIELDFRLSHLFFFVGAAKAFLDKIETIYMDFIG